MTEKTVVIALGGNAIRQHNEKGTITEQIANVRRASRQIAQIAADGYTVAVTHGNGPQVGDILLRNELTEKTLPAMPLDVCGAESQGMIGYLLQQSMREALRAAGVDRPVVTVLTQTVVNDDDPAFGRPEKPVGPLYTAEQAESLRKEKDWQIVQIPGRGYRRVVPSPRPLTLVEGEVIFQLFSAGVIVIAAGGGGVPVVADGRGALSGVEGVVDKDHTAAILAHIVGAEVLLILTDVECVSLNYGQPDRQDIYDMTVDEAREHLAAGHFAPGSMGPKVAAAINFIEAGGERATIASLGAATAALAGRSGTRIRR